jgi:uncharacterized membrane protein/YHS domain-containing protein
MSFYLSQVLSYFLLPAVLFGVLWAGAAHPLYKARFWCSLCAMSAGTLTYAFLPYSQVYIFIIGSLYFSVLVLLLLYSFIAPKANQYLVVWQFLFLVLVSFMWARMAKLTMISATSVINTELILNLAALIFGFILIGLAHVYTSRVFAQRSQRFRSMYLISFILLACLPVSGEVLLAAMKLQIVDLYQGLLSYVSKVTNFYWIYSYVALVLSATAALVLLVRDITPLKLLVKAQNYAIARRKAQAVLNQQQSVLRGFSLSLLLVSSGLTYWDAVASQPPTRSPATPIELAADGAIHVPVNEQLKDGKLHRYQWVASDGKVVRFFIIDRYPGEMKFGVVFDACMLCGDGGYIQSGEQVICLACGVHIFIPSIGNPGGCNPIPIKEWSLNSGDIVIDKAMLESGLQFFSEVVKINVTDPVSGTLLTNLDAPFNYAFGGKTYFFAAQASYDAFRDNPWQYVEQSSALGEQ